MAPLYSVIFILWVTFVDTTPVDVPLGVEPITDGYGIANDSEIVSENSYLRYSPDIHDAMDHSNLDVQEQPHDETEPSGMEEDLFQGDLKMDNPEQFFSDASDRTATSKKRRLWPSGIVPFVIDAAFNTNEQSIIRRAMKSLGEESCLKLVSRTNQHDYLHLIKGKGCWSYWGRIGKGRQELSLGNGCVYNGIVLHEVMHAVGFVHEHNRPDRDTYVTINWDAIKAEKRDNFKKLSWSVVTSLGVPYDYASVMHYGRYTFAKDKKTPTITPHFRTARMGQRRALSSKDARKINLLYDCESGGNSPVFLPAPGTRHSPIINEVPEMCMDLNSYCNWLRLVHGFLCQPGSWMAYNCPSTCGLCGKV